MNRSINRTSIVSSRELREFDDKIQVELSHTYHRMLRLYGQIKTVSTSTILLENSVADVLRYGETSEENQIIINPMTQELYPSSLSEYEKAEKSIEFGIFHAKKIETQLVFTDESGEEIKPTIQLTRTSENSLYLEAPDSIIENYIDNVIIGDVPYIARFEKQDMSKSQISLDIISKDNKFKINALKYIPMPGAGSVSLDNVMYDGIHPIVLNGNVQYIKSESYDIKRTLPGYIHFNPVDTNLLRIAVSSDKYIEKLKAVAVGLSKIVGEMNIYAQVSYIGYKVDFPTDMTKLKSVTINPDGYAGSLSGVYLRIYNSEVEFNNMSNNYLIRTGVNQEVNVDKPLGSLYILMEIEAKDNTSPCVKDIHLEFD